MSRVIVDVEVCLKSSSSARPAEVRERMAGALERSCAADGGRLTAGPISTSSFSGDDFLTRNVRHARVCELSVGVSFWQTELRM